MIEIDEAAPDHSWAFPGNSQERAWLVRQIEGGPSWYAHENLPVAIFGLFRQTGQDKRGLEAWLIAGGAASSRIVQLVRVFRKILRRFGTGTDPILCTVRPGHAPGERLARLLGFAPTGEIFNAPGTPVHGVQFWRYEP